MSGGDIYTLATAEQVALLDRPFESAAVFGTRLDQLVSTIEERALPCSARRDQTKIRWIEQVCE